MAKKHDINQIAAWARDWGINGFEHLDPKAREQKRMTGLKKQRDRSRKEDDRKYSSKR
jgi:hypothetical protein